MDQTRLDAIRARCEAATPGPWTLKKDGRYEDHDECRIDLPDDNIELCRYENGEFIAHARTDVPDLLAEIARLTADLAAMTTERDEARDKLDWLTEAYDRKMRVHDALNRDYVALRKRAEAAERDMAFACGSQPSASSDCSICDICAHKRDDGSCAKQCFMNAMAAMNRWEWRGPQEDKPDATKEASHENE